MIARASSTRPLAISGRGIDGDASSERLARRDEYWDSYYRHHELPARPSPFAEFVHDAAASDASAVIDVGCGNGRDSFYFAGRGVPTIGVDASASAIQLCRAQVPDPPPPIAFMHSSVDSPDVLQRLRDEAGRIRRSEGPLVVYARFFLHAITRSSESDFLDLASSLLCDTDGVLAVEFRTIHDKGRPKQTECHYRRYVDPTKTIAAARAHGMRLDFFVEGLGYARYKDEDAHVARCLFVK